MTDGEAREFLSKNGWLAGTPPDFRVRLLDRSRIVRVPTGETVYRLGDDAGGLCGLASGALLIDTASVHGQPAISFIIHPGSWAGEGGVVLRVRRRVGLIAAQPSVLAYLPLNEFDRLAELDAQVWRWISQLSVENLNTAITVAHDLMLNDSKMRVAAILLHLSGCRHFDLESAPTVRLSQDQLARIVNLSRSALNEILSAFESAGWLTKGYRSLTIQDSSQLRRLADA